MAIFQTENQVGLPTENQDKPDQELPGNQFCRAFQYLPPQGGSSKKVNLSVDLFHYVAGRLCQAVANRLFQNSSLRWRIQKGQPQG